LIPNVESADFLIAKTLGKTYISWIEYVDKITSIDLTTSIKTRSLACDYRYSSKLSTFKAFTFGAHVNFGPFLASSVASFGEFCTKK
jgi:hypothetical protein